MTYSQEQRQKLVEAKHNQRIVVEAKKRKKKKEHEKRNKCIEVGKETYNGFPIAVR